MVSYIYNYEYNKWKPKHIFWTKPTLTLETHILGMCCESDSGPGIFADLVFVVGRHLVIAPGCIQPGLVNFN